MLTLFFVGNAIDHDKARLPVFRHENGLLRFLSLGANIVEIGSQVTNGANKGHGSGHKITSINK